MKNMKKSEIKNFIFFSTNLIQIKMDYYCSEGAKTIKSKSNINHPESLTHIQYEKCNQINRTINNPSFFDIDKKFNEYVTNHNKIFDLYLVKCDFKLVFNNYTSHNKTDLYHDATIINFEKIFFILD